ncbi:MAG: DNA adenine methylase [Gemmatimonadetes bacterium]|nr:DNA adenine methylase [Gemmatimonadota bacterium]
MNYIGSKYSLRDFLEAGVLKNVDADCKVFCDVFAGTGVVGTHFKQKGFKIIANDIQYYSFCLNRALVGISQVPAFDGVLDDGKIVPTTLICDATDIVLEYLNTLDGRSGFIYRNYCPGGTEGTEFKRQYFSDENGRRCDAIRMQIEDWWQAGKLTEDEYFYLLASLIDGADRVANTASIYGAFLKHIKKSALKPLQLKRLGIVESDEDHEVHNVNGQALVEHLSCDVLYMDPPYNHRQYCANYHVLETIARYDDPVLKGVTGLRPHDEQKSDFCMKRRALPAFEEMVRKTSAQYVFLSYNSEGIMGKNEILQTMGQYGQVDLMTRDYQRFRADVDRENRVYKADQVEEYLFCLSKQ